MRMAIEWKVTPDSFIGPTQVVTAGACTLMGFAE